MVEPDPLVTDPSRSTVPDRPLLVLIGPPAAGKTRVGKRVARILNVPFIDTDAVITAQHGAIATIFAERGEPAFRELEAEAVADALTHRAVVALGGGAVMTASIADALAGHPVVLLTISTEAAAARLDPVSRPLVAAGIGAWQELVDRRMPVYERLAVARWDTSSRPIDHIAAEIADWAHGIDTSSGEASHRHPDQHAPAAPPHPGES